MRYMLLFLFAIGLFATPVSARHRYYYDGYGNRVYTQSYASPYAYDRGYGYDRGYDSDYDYSRVRSHKRRRNVLLGVGALGLVTGHGALTGIGLGGAAANEIIDRRNRDW